MKLKILSTIAAISATATSASSLTCGDVQALYQDGACCSENSQSCVKSLSIADGSELDLSTNGELSIDLSGKASLDGAIFNGAVTFESPLTFQTNAKINGKDALTSNEYLPANIATYCGSDTHNSPAYAHGFRSVWNTGWGGAAGGGWEMVLGAGNWDYSTACVVRQIVLGTSQLHTNGKIYGEQFMVPSDSRIKKDIVDADIEDTLQKVRDIELKEYSYNNPNREGEKTVGFIAQQVKEVYPNAIKIDIRSNAMHNEAGERVEIPDLHRVNKDKIFALHHGALQSLDAKIAALEARLAALEPQPTA